MNIASEILKKLADFENEFVSCGLPQEASKYKEWGGADVIISKRENPSNLKWFEDQPFVISQQKTQPRKRLVITEHAAELSWLFDQLKEIYRTGLDYVSKYDFYGQLAQAALDSLEENPDIDAFELCLEVIKSAKQFWWSEAKDA